MNVTAQQRQKWYARYEAYNLPWPKGENDIIFTVDGIHYNQFDDDVDTARHMIELVDDRCVSEWGYNCKICEGSVVIK